MKEAQGNETIAEYTRKAQKIRERYI